MLEEKKGARMWLGTKEREGRGDRRERESIDFIIHDIHHGPRFSVTGFSQDVNLRKHFFFMKTQYL